MIFDNLPFDVVFEIYRNFSLIERQKLCLVNKDFNKLWSRDLKNIKIIVKYMNKNCKINDTYDDIENCKILYRFYIQKYNMQYLQSYPELILKKSIQNETRKNKIKNYINTNLNENLKKRTRKDIYLFFKNNNITMDEIHYTGW